MAPCRFCFDGNCGGDKRDEEVLRWVLDQRGHGAGVLTIAMADMGVVSVEIAMEGVQGAVNETADKENK